MRAKESAQAQRGNRAAAMLATSLLGMTALAVATAPPAIADTPMAVAVRAGTTGIGLDYDVGFAQYFSARIGYSGFTYDHAVDTSDVDYSGKFKLSMVDGLIDWYAFKGGFHLTAGAVGNGTTLDVVGKPAAGGYTIDGTYFPSADVGSLRGELKFGNPVSPYVGLGWGDAVGTKHHLHFLFDIGAIYGGVPNVTLTAVCGSASPRGTSTCTALQSDVQGERLKLQNDVTLVQWYPVIDVGLAYRF